MCSLRVCAGFRRSVEQLYGRSLGGGARLEGGAPGSGDGVRRVCREGRLAVEALQSYNHAIQNLAKSARLLQYGDLCTSAEGQATFCRFTPEFATARVLRFILRYTPMVSGDDIEEMISRRTYVFFV